MPRINQPSRQPVAIGLIIVAVASSVVSARADPASDEATRQSMMADMRSSAATNDRANFESQQRQQADAARYSNSGNSGSSTASSGTSTSAGGVGTGGYRSVGPRSVVSSYTFTVRRQESSAALASRLQTEATAGNALSAFNLGRILYTGFDGIPRNDASARHWFGEAARLGHPGAQ